MMMMMMMVVDNPHIQSGVLLFGINHFFAQNPKP